MFTTSSRISVFGNQGCRAGVRTRPSAGLRAALVAGATTISVVVLSGGSALAGVTFSGPHCGATITANTVLHSDLANCPGDGLVIGADNISLNLNGHTVGGDGVPGATSPDVGIRIQGHHGVIVESGSLRLFDEGVGLNASAGVRLDHLNISTNAAFGIHLANNSDFNLVENSLISLNGAAGIFVESSADNTVRGNVTNNNTFNGILVLAGARNRFENSILSGNGDNLFLDSASHDNQINHNSSSNSGQGIALDGTHNTVMSNHVFRNQDDIILNGDHNAVVANLVTDALGCAGGGCGFGISTEGGTGNLVADNTIARTLRPGIRLDAYSAPAIGTVFRHNMVIGAAVDGIAIDLDQVGPVLNTLLEGNLVIGTGSDGIHVQSPATTLTRNVALHNRALGIEAVPGVVDGGGNLAFGNGNPVECTNVACGP